MNSNSKEGTHDLLGAWEFRKGLDEKNVGRPGGVGWRPVKLPMRFHRFVPELRGYRGWITLRRSLTGEQSALLRSGKTISYFSGTVGDVARFYLNNRPIGRLGSVKPYRPAYSRFLLTELPLLSSRPDAEPDILTMALYTNGQYPLWHNKRMFLGSNAAVNFRFYGGEIVTLVLTAIYLMVGLVNIAIWMGQRNERYFLYFGLFAISYSIWWVLSQDSRDLVLSDWVFTRRKIELIALTGVTPFAWFFVEAYFRKEHGIVSRSFALLYSLLALITLVTWHPKPMQYARIVVQGTSVLVVVYSVYFLVRYMQRGSLSMKFFAVAIIIFALTALHDIAAAVGLLDTNFLMSYSLSLVVIGVGSTIIGRFVRTHKRVEELAAKNKVMYAELLEHRNRLVEENTALITSSNVIAEKMIALAGGREIVYAGEAMTRTVHHIEKAAENAENVLILGESGTGKELAASMIHQKSARQDRPFLAVNCGALSETLLDSELFGHERGAFTGAHKERRGIFEQAHGGTIFLDEIGDITPALQVKLLRVLQERNFTRLGSEKIIQVDVRVVAATNRDLTAAVNAGDFRADLFYRLNVILIRIPPLRERKEDIPLLVNHSLKKFADKLGKPEMEVRADALAVLHGHNWPGNVRELENVLLRAAVNGESSELTKADFAGLAATNIAPPPTSPGTSSPIGGVSPDGGLVGAEQELIVRALEKTGGNKTAAAKVLGIDRGTLRRKLKRYNLD